MRPFPHYIFGYGSLICPSSRAITAPTLAGRAATPVRVKNLQRLWSLRIPNAGMIAMGIRRKENAECVGVLVPVNDEELAQFDIRELGYDRVPVEHHHVERISSLDQQTHYDHEHSFHRQSTLQSRGPITIWVYVQQDPMPVSPEYPIAQSYLDVILRGCMTISPEFAKDFLKTTRGWHPRDFHDAEIPASQDENKSDEEGVAFWVNDRHSPLYVRADVEYSKSAGDQLDRLLQDHRPEMSSRRNFYGRSPNF
jgi:hypothetical protein